MDHNTSMDGAVSRRDFIASGAGVAGMAALGAAAAEKQDKSGAPLLGPRDTATVPSRRGGKTSFTSRACHLLTTGDGQALLRDPPAEIHDAEARGSGHGHQETTPGDGVRPASERTGS